MGLEDIYKKVGISGISIDFNPSKFSEPIITWRFFSGVVLGFYPFTIIVWRTLK